VVELVEFRVLAIELPDVLSLIRTKASVSGTTIYALSFRESFGGRVLDVDRLDIAGPSPTGEIYIRIKIDDHETEYIYRGRFLIHRWHKEIEGNPHV
jgi:hypothetical protein